MVSRLIQICLFGMMVNEVSAFAPPLGKFFRSHAVTMVATKDVTMPALSSTMVEGKVVAWSKKIGEKVTAGDVLLVVESDKADMDVESFEDGYLAAIYTPEGGSAAVGATVAVLVENVADIASVSSKPSTVIAPVAAVSVSAETVPVKTAPSAASVGISSDMYESVMMPALSSTMTEGKVVSWSKKIGEKISSGDMVLIVESDKADMDVESYEEGFLAAILVGDGEVAPVGSPVGLMAKSLADIPAVQAYAASLKAGGAAPPAAVVAAVATTNMATPSASAQPAAAGPFVPGEGTINASPQARKLAAENNLDVTKIKGTGNFGRVMPDDVLIAAGKKSAVVAAPAVVAPTVAAVAPAAVKTAAVAAAAPPAAKAVSVSAAVMDPVAVEGIVPMDGMQKAVAKNMEKTLAVPIFRVSREIATDNFDALYAVLKPKGVTVSAMLAKAVAEVLKKHPVVNAAYVEGGIKYNKDVNVAMAVAIDGGLITPTITKANEKDLFTISRNWKELVDKAKNKKLTPAEYNSGTFTISNLGMFGVAQFDAILPPGTGSILAIAASTPKVVQLKTGHFGVQKSMTVTITCDHRHIYGADAAEFLKDLADLLENHTNTLTMG